MNGTQTLYLSVLTTVSVIFTPSALHAQAQSTPFQDGDRVTFIGDSITHKGLYPRFVELYYLTRFPDRKISFFNCGISGNTGQDVLNRFDSSIAIHKPTRATVMLGMNDINRRLYKPNNKDKVAERAERINAYAYNLDKIIDRLEALDAGITLIGPSIYDETAQVDRAPEIGVNGGLILCSQRARDIATSRNVGFFDLNAPMLAINEKLQAKNPGDTIVSHDRVHPWIKGNLFMAAEFLKAQNVPSLVSLYAIDVRSRRVMKVSNAEIDVSSASANRVEFRGRAKALPFPWLNKAENLFEVSDFQDALNRELLGIQHLESGTYSLSIDGVKIAGFSAEQLAAGVNLGPLANTPQNIQARNVYEALTRVHKTPVENRTPEQMKALYTMNQPTWHTYVIERVK